MTTLYTMTLFRVMREMGLHEGPVEQAYRLFAEHLSCGTPRVDDAGRIRLDDLELRPDVQREVNQRLALITTANLDELSDRRDYHRAVLRLYGFGCPGVDYRADVEPVRPIPSVRRLG
jgi:enoyl-[acyl-carrier protein] reductase/trans-2-enoyl-CoA reductase (NAD+)